MRCARRTPRGLRRDDDLVCFDLADAFPWDPSAVRFSRPALDEPAGAADKRDDLALFAMHLMDAAQKLAVQRPDLLVAEVRQPHQSAPQCGIRLPAEASLLCRPRSRPEHLRWTDDRIVRTLSIETRVSRLPAIFLTSHIAQAGMRPE